MMPAQRCVARAGRVHHAVKSAARAPDGALRSLVEHAVLAEGHEHTAHAPAPHDIARHLDVFRRIHRAVAQNFQLHAVGLDGVKASDIRAKLPRPCRGNRIEIQRSVADL